MSNGNPPDDGQLSIPTQALTPQVVAYVRQKGASQMLDKLCDWMFKIHHPELGKVIEAIMQVLPDEDFDIIGALCLGYESDDLIQQFAASIVVRLAGKQGMQIIEYDKYLNASKNFLLLVAAEARRRTGDVEYIFPDDLFQDMTNLQFIKLTPEGREKVMVELLEKFESNIKQ